MKSWPVFLVKLGQVGFGLNIAQYQLSNLYDVISYHYYYFVWNTDNKSHMAFQFTFSWHKYINTYRRSYMTSVLTLFSNTEVLPNFIASYNFLL